MKAQHVSRPGFGVQHSQVVLKSSTFDRWRDDVPLAVSKKHRAPRLHHRSGSERGFAGLPGAIPVIGAGTDLQTGGWVLIDGCEVRQNKVQACGDDVLWTANVVQTSGFEPKCKLSALSKLIYETCRHRPGSSFLDHVPDSLKSVAVYAC